MSACPSVRPSVRLSAWTNSATTGRIFMKFYIWIFFENLSKKIEISLKSEKKNGYFTWTPIYIFDHISLSSSQNEKCFIVVEKIKTHILCSITLFKIENHVIYEIMWKNVVKPGRPQMTIGTTRITYWLPKSTNTHSDYVILIAFALQKWLKERATMSCYTYKSSLVWYGTMYIISTEANKYDFYSTFLLCPAMNTDVTANVHFAPHAEHNPVSEFAALKICWYPFPWLNS